MPKIPPKAADAETVLRRNRADAAIRGAGMTRDEVAPLVGKTKVAFAHYFNDRSMPDEVYRRIGRVTGAPNAFLDHGWAGFKQLGHQLAADLLDRALRDAEASDIEDDDDEATPAT